MRRLLFILFLTTSPVAAQPPKLAVLIVVDQFPSSHLHRMPSHGALLGVLERAAAFQDARQDHVPTATAPGHASISTGRSPAVHGIIGNEIYDRTTGKAEAAIADSVNGASAARLAVPTLADAVRKKYPESRVVSVSIKDRAAILLGGKSPTAALWFDKWKHGFVTSKAYGERPAWVDPVNESLSWLLSDVKAPFTKADWSASPAADQAVLSLALGALRAEQMGRHDTPDLLLISFSATDAIGHHWGPDSPQMAAQLVELDKRLGELFAATESAAPGRVVYAFTSDHGVLPVPESEAGLRMKARRENPDALRKRLEARLQGAKPAPGQPWILHLDPPDIYLNRNLAGAAGDWAGWLRMAASLLSREPDVAAVYVPGVPAGSDKFSGIYQRSYFAGRSGDLQIRLEPGLLLSGWPTGTNHGSPYPYDMTVPLLLWGAGIRPVQSWQEVSVESLAPTLATVLGVDLPAADGRVLTEALKP